MLNIKWLDLQLFAGEGAGDGGGEGAAMGVTNANPGDADQTLRELGVPQAVLEKRAKRNASKPKSAARPAPVQAKEQVEEQAAAAENPTEEKTDAPTRMSWEEIKADPEYKAEMQKMMQERVKKAKEAEEALSKATPLLSMIAKKYGQDAENIDYDALTKAVFDDDGTFEDQALEEGKLIDDVRKQAYDNLERQKIQQHLMKLEQQGEALKKVFPKFDLRTELQNPVFARMTSPSVGLSVEDAYYAVHRQELQSAAMQVTAQKVAQKISNDIQSGSRRPNENGTSGQAPSVTTFDYRSASREQREALKKRIRSGEKIYPGQM